MQDYLLEIGVEELPARFIADASKQLKEKFENFLDENQFKYEEVITYSTPRRLTVIAKNLDETQEDTKVEVKGPSAKIAFDEEGKPSKALKGFMKSQGLTEEDIEVRDNYIYANKIILARTIDEIFQEGLPDLIKSINFPKNMRWGGKNIRFARPIRWLASVLGNREIKINLEGIISSNITRGHRFLGSSNITIDNPKNYKVLLKENYVIVDQEERKNLIKREAGRLAKEMCGQFKPDPDLLDELTNINEYPTPILGKIKDEHLLLPSVVVTTSMKEHLRFIPIYNDEEELLPYFISIVNGTDEHKDVVIKGNEKVLTARLEDAVFFYKEDLNTDFNSLSDKLEGIIYHEKLGSMKLRVERITDLVEKIGEQLDIAKESQDQLRNAAELSKSDMLTYMVNEFSELQGIMGENYAKKAGHDNLVATAIREQYLPRFAGDDLPDTTVGSILSIGDKLDSIAGMFAIGLIPTGSQDPFGLRRAALGIINIIRKNNWRISIKDAIKDALYVYVDKNNLVFDYDKVSGDIYKFILSRIKVILLDEGIRYDLVDALIEMEDEDIYNIFQKAQELKAWFEAGDRTKEVESFARLNNIAIKAEDNLEFSADIFNDHEKTLYSEFTNLRDRIKENNLELDYTAMLEEIVKLKDPINNYLDNVLVFDEDVTIKNNRLGFLNTINTFVRNIIDFSKIAL